MKKSRAILFLLSHSMVGLFGFAFGIYYLPILTAPVSPTIQQLEMVLKDSRYNAQFVRSLTDSDFLHWGEGQVDIGNQYISFRGQLSPGPDFKLYLSPTFVETEAQFLQLKSTMVNVGDVNTFNHFIVAVDQSINIEDYTTVIVWCESFEQFITSAKYK